MSSRNGLFHTRVTSYSAYKPLWVCPFLLGLHKHLTLQWKIVSTPNKHLCYVLIIIFLKTEVWGAGGVCWGGVFWYYSFKIPLSSEGLQWTANLNAVNNLLTMKTSVVHYYWYSGLIRLHLRLYNINKKIKLNIQKPALHTNEDTHLVN